MSGQNNSERVVAIIQARMGSSRFPGKMMAEVGGKPLIEWILTRVKRAGEPDDVVLAIPFSKENDVLADVAIRFGVQPFRGNELDVLDRFEKAARSCGADWVVRVCADNPFIDPGEIDRLVRFYRKRRPDYAFNHSNRLGNRYADGFGAEILSRAVLDQIAKCAAEPRHREHVTLYLWDNPDCFDLATFPAPDDLAYPELRFDVDTLDDLAKLDKLALKVGIEGSAACFVRANLQAT